MGLLSKLLPLFVLPLGVSLMLLLWGLIRRRRACLWGGVLVLLVASQPFAGRYLIRSVEGWADRRSVHDVPTADAIVVLSAGRVLAPGKDRVSEWGDANRFFGGVELLQSGKAPLLIFTAAWFPWEPEAPLEGDVLARYAGALGIPSGRIAVTGKVSNTADEAVEVATLLRERRLGTRILLVTSAFHMARARQVFEQSGLTVEPFPVHFWFSQGSRVTPMDILPSVGALQQTHTALRELYGRASYWARSRF